MEVIEICRLRCAFHQSRIRDTSRSRRIGNESSKIRRDPSARAVPGSRSSHARTPKSGTIRRQRHDDEKEKQPVPPRSFKGFVESENIQGQRSKQHLPHTPRQLV